MRPVISVGILILIFFGCHSEKRQDALSQADKNEIRNRIQQRINEGVEATRTKNIDQYMSQLPEDLIIYGENGEIISRDQQKTNALRDWSIIDTTIKIMMNIDSIQFLKKDSIVVFTYQEWERMMFRQDGVTTDTVLTTQRHKETWRKTEANWFGYEIEELGGEIFINGKAYTN